MKSKLVQLVRATLLMLAPVLAFAADAPAPRRVAMIFDDGPSVEQSEKMQAVLAREKIHVSFANVGQNVRAQPQLSRAAAQGGHEIVNHSYTHPHLMTLDDAAVEKQIRDTSAAIQEATGKPPALFWAPFLEHDDRVDRMARAAGLEHFPLKQVHFISTEDWNSKTDAATIRQRATTDVQDKTVILCHEWRDATLAELPAIITELKRQGCVFLTFSEMAALVQAPGAQR
jgi:peptidoglycan/xylan/chitin deacetylase (PgdA/CDA1 family)